MIDLSFYANRLDQEVNILRREKEMPVPDPANVRLLQSRIKQLGATLRKATLEAEREAMEGR